MKKNDAVYGLLDGRIVPLPRCSFMNLRSSAISVWDSWISLAGRDAGAPGFNSIAWSHNRDGGNSWEASSLKTLENDRYCQGIFKLGTSSGSPMTTLPMNIWSACVGRGRLTVRRTNLALAASGLRKITGS